MAVKYIVENFEKKIGEWCFYEYEHISEIVGKSNIAFTNAKGDVAKKISSLGETAGKRAAEFIPKSARVCVLDMDAEQQLTPKDAKNFDYMVFGGILGTNPPAGRTKMIYEADPKATKQWQKRNLGKRQMSTDTAVNVAKQVLDGKPMEKIEFEDDVELVMSKGRHEGESMILPYRYIKDDKKKHGFVIATKLLNYLKNKKGF